VTDTSTRPRRPLPLPEQDLPVDVPNSWATWLNRIGPGTFGSGSLRTSPATRRAVLMTPAETKFPRSQPRAGSGLQSAEATGRAGSIRSSCAVSASRQRRRGICTEVQQGAEDCAAASDPSHVTWRPVVLTLLRFLSRARAISCPLPTCCLTGNRPGSCSAECRPVPGAGSRRRTHTERHDRNDAPVTRQSDDARRTPPAMTGQRRPLTVGRHSTDGHSHAAPPRRQIDTSAAN
jgi:hypothetical protein